MNVRSFAILATTLLCGVPSFAVRMDETTHDEIIKRLELGVDNMGKDEPERIGVLGRLGELYADRARLKAMNEVEKNCQKCDGATKDRVRAITLYNEVLPKVQKDKQGPIVLQLAHLHDLNNQSAKAVALYQGILKAPKAKYSSEVRAIAESSVGEIHFRKGEFKEALSHYEKARREKLKNKALVEYRIAWSQLNLGQNDKAIQTLVRLLKSPAILATQSADGQSVDASFVADASKDLARFLARARVGRAELDLLLSLSPEKERKGNLYVLATETDRLGKKREALVAWAAYVDEGDVLPNEKLEVQIRVAKIHYDLNQQEQASEAFAKALGLWKKNGCLNNDELCTELKSRVRQMVTAMNKAQKQKPTRALFRMYVAYGEVFQDDGEMLNWGAQVGVSLGEHKDTARLFHRAAAVSAQALKTKPNDKALQNIFESSLLGEIEQAEALKDPGAREAAYNWYLTMNPNGPEAFDVRYQRAHLFYETNRLKEAFAEFHALAMSPGKDHRDQKVKAADLSLDSLVSLKDDPQLKVRGEEYARQFPERKAEYLKISRKATMNIVATDLKNEKRNDQGDYKSSLVALNAVNLDGADDVERIKFLKNKIVVAQKALDLGAVRQTSEQLQHVKTLTESDREWALEQQVWVAELQLDFNESYRLTKRMKTPKLSAADRELRLALLAELADRNARPHHEAFLRLAKNGRAANLVRVTLVKNSGNPWRELKVQLPFLKQTPDLLAGLTLEVFAKHRDLKRLEETLKIARIERTAAGVTLARQLSLRDFAKFDHEIRSHHIRGYSDHAMQSSLKERLSLIARSGQLANEAVRRHDWTMQTLTLSVLARENRRLYHDILSLPVPARLKGPDRVQYQTLLKQQSEPYLATAEKIDQQLEQAWNDSGSIANMQTTFNQASSELRGLYRTEISQLTAIAPANAKSRLQSLMNTPFERPSSREILTARQELKAHPFDASRAQALRDLESRAGDPAMIAFLDERISQLKAK